MIIEIEDRFINMKEVSLITARAPNEVSQFEDQSGPKGIVRIIFKNGYIEKFPLHSDTKAEVIEQVNKVSSLINSTKEIDDETEKSNSGN